MKVKMTVTTGYNGKKIKPNDIVTIDDKIGKQWIKDGVAIKVKETKRTE